MKWLIAYILLTVSPAALAQMKASDRVNLHMKSAEKVSETEKTRKQIENLKNKEISSSHVNNPDKLRVESRPLEKVRDAGDASPGSSEYSDNSITSIDEEVSNEAYFHDMAIINEPKRQEEEKERFIDQFKSNAEAAGLKIEIDPDTLEAKVK